MTKSATAAAKRRVITTASANRESKLGVAAFKRARILEEAVALFFEKGYEAATLEMLADRLSVTKPFIYSYYKGKTAILSAICETGVKESLLALDRISEAERTSLDILRSSLREVAEITIARHEYLVVYQRELMNLERADAQRILRLRHEFDLRVAQLIENCVADGFVKDADAASMSIWIGGIIVWITSCYRPDREGSAKTVADQAVKACLRLIKID